MSCFAEIGAALPLVNYVLDFPAFGVFRGGLAGGGNLF
jgi:hypothetical protein